MHFKLVEQEFHNLVKIRDEHGSSQIPRRYRSLAEYGIRSLNKAHWHGYFMEMHL